MPIDETSEILSRVKQMGRFLWDRGDRGSFDLIFDKIVDLLRVGLMERLWKVCGQVEASSKR